MTLSAQRRADFEVLARDPSGRARAGLLHTAHGAVETPVFMPVATQGTVKSLSQEDLDALGVRAILSNSYHLYLRPGAALIKAAGGLHRFMGYGGAILTDSGGFQVMSLSDLRKISDEGVEFRSHIDGSLHALTPRSVIEVQEALGSDIWTCLDECPPYPCPDAQAEKALERTMRWIDASLPAVAAARGRGAKSLFFPILQGAFSAALRRRAADHLAALGPDGVSLGGFSVGEPKALTWETLEASVAALPPELPRYLMGVGTPEDLWEAVARGVDMMDCVFPTRVARNGMAMTRTGRLNITASTYRADQGPLDPLCSCFVCGRYSRSYLSHLYRAKELLVYRLLTYHNLHLMAGLTAEIRAAVRAGRFEAARKAFLDGREAPALDNQAGNKA